MYFALGKLSLPRTACAARCSSPGVFTGEGGYSGQGLAAEHGEHVEIAVISDVLHVLQRFHIVLGDDEIGVRVVRRLVVVNESGAKTQLGDGRAVCQGVSLVQDHGKFLL